MKDIVFVSAFYDIGRNKWNTKYTIKKVAEWYKFDKSKKIEITKSQIKEYYAK